MTYTGVAISGKAGAGKTTLAKAILELTRPHLRGASFAAALKDDLARIDVEKGDPGFRELAQIYGTEHARAKYGADYWVRRLAETNRGTLEGLVIDDMRFPNEHAACSRAGLLLVRVDAPYLVRTERLGYPCPDHSSETAMDGIDHDLDLYVDGDKLAATPAALAQVVLGYLDLAAA